MEMNAGRQGDATGHGGVLLNGSGDVYINGYPAAIAGVTIASCSLLHCAAPVVCGSGTVFINGQPAARLGDLTGCCAPIICGSSDVYIGG